MLTLTSSYKNQGFSLIELMIAVALFVFLFGLAMPGYKVWMQNTRIRAAAESLQNGMQKAKSEALRLNASVRFTINLTDASWNVGCVNSSTTCPAIIDSGSGTTTDIDIGTDNGYASLTFNNLGIKESSLAASEFNSIDIDMDNSVMTAADSRDLAILVSAGGSIKMCDPNLNGTSDFRKCA